MKQILFPSDEDKSVQRVESLKRVSDTLNIRDIPGNPFTNNLLL